jgi:hypothetical protein
MSQDPAKNSSSLASSLAAILVNFVHFNRLVVWATCLRSAALVEGQADRMNSVLLSVVIIFLSYYLEGGQGTGVN